MGMKVFVRIACITWLKTGHHGKIDDSNLKERLHYLIKISIFLFAFAVSEETGRSPAGIVGSNPTGGMDICLL
jgi:hypothetical protein